jgi:hypothetical protein
MQAAAETELLEISRKLSPKNRREWLNYGRTLTTQTEKKLAVVEEDGDASWERIIADSKPRPKLDVMAAKILAEMKSGKHFPPMRVEDL